MRVHVKAMPVSGPDVNKVCVSSSLNIDSILMHCRQPHEYGRLVSASRISIHALQKRSSSSKTPEDPQEPKARQVATIGKCDSTCTDRHSSKLATPAKRLLAKITPVKSHENIYTVPNILTFTRLVAAPLVGYLLVHDYHAAALSLFAYAGITDLVDGYIARRYSLQTVVGTIIDPMADKLLMTVGVACLAVNGSLPGASQALA